MRLLAPIKQFSSIHALLILFTEDIQNDLYDLAGVRVILIVSTPEQRDKVKAILHSIWGDNIEEKVHEGSEPSPFYKAKHIGYEGIPSKDQGPETSTNMIIIDSCSL